MAKTIIKRILQIIPTLFVVVTLTFVLTRMIPGDPVTAMVGEQADPELMDKVRTVMGLNDPLPKQYIDYLGGILHGDFGRSFYYNSPATEVIFDRLPNTLSISLISLVISVAAGLLLGVLSALNQYSIWDYALTVLALVGVSLPIFWFGLMLVLLFSVELGWLPNFGMGSLSNGLWDVVRHMIMPCICLAIGPTATFTRMTRSSMIEAMNNDSINSLRARGIHERRVVWKHALKNALPPVVTVIGMQFAGMFAGAVLTEKIFSWPGMGTMISNAIENRDYTLIQGSVLIIAIAFVLINLFADLVYMLIDPKVAAENDKG